MESNTSNQWHPCAFTQSQEHQDEADNNLLILTLMVEDASAYLGALSRAPFMEIININ